MTFDFLTRQNKLNTCSSTPHDHITFSYEDGEMVSDSLRDQALKDVEIKLLSVRRVNWSVNKVQLD
jgi:hypothetical protein